MSIEDEDWLALPKSGQELFLEALGDDTSNPVRDLKLPDTVNPEYAAVIRAYRKLRPQQRMYCKALIRCNGRRTKALRMLREEQFVVIDPSTVSRWHKDPRFVRAVELTKKQCLEYAEIDPASLMLRAGEIVDDAMEPQPIVNKKGEVVGYDTDRQSALRGIEWLGKVHKMGGDENTNRTTLNLIVNLATREELVELPKAIEGEFTESDD